MIKTVSHRSRRGITRRELLLVVGLLAIPVALLSLVVTRHKVKRDYRTCQTNLEKIALGFKQYMKDYDERYPLVFMTDVAGTTYIPPYGWADALQPYLKDTSVLQCPADASYGDSNSGKENFSDYWYNANFVRRINRKSGVIFTGVNESVFGSPSATIMAGDGGNPEGTVTGDARYNQCGDGTSLSQRTQTCRQIQEAVALFPGAQMHLQGANFLFAGGNVKWFKANQNSRSLRITNNGSLASSAGSNPPTFSLLNS